MITAHLRFNRPCLKNSINFLSFKLEHLKQRAKTPEAEINNKLPAKILP